MLFYSKDDLFQAHYDKAISSDSENSSYDHDSLSHKLQRFLAAL